MANKEFKVEPTYFMCGSLSRVKRELYAVVNWQGKTQCTCETRYLANKIKKALNNG